jgi:hypothetical protein
MTKIASLEARVIAAEAELAESIDMEWASQLKQAEAEKERKHLVHVAACHASELEEMFILMEKTATEYCPWCGIFIPKLLGIAKSNHRYTCEAANHCLWPQAKS